MIDERNRERMKRALVDAFGPPRPDLERLALASIEQRRVRRVPSRMFALAAVAVVLVLAAFYRAGDPPDPARLANYRVSTAECSAAARAPPAAAEPSGACIGWWLPGDAASHERRCLEGGPDVIVALVWHQRPDLWSGRRRNHRKPRLLLPSDLAERCELPGDGSRSRAKAEWERAHRVRRATRQRQPGDDRHPRRDADEVLRLGRYSCQPNDGRRMAPVGNDARGARAGLLWLPDRRSVVPEYLRYRGIAGRVTSAGADPDEDETAKVAELL